MTVLAGAPSSHVALRVVEVDPQTDPRWERFVAEHPEGLIYHHPAWLQVLEAEYHRRPVAMVCEDADGQIRGVLPLLETRGLPFNLGEHVTSRRLSSLPRTPVAGPLALDCEDAAVLVRAAVERVRAMRGTRLQIKAASAQLDQLVEGVGGAPWEFTYVLELPERLEDLRFGNSRNHARIKWAIGKAARLGVQVRPAVTEDELRAWYELYLDTMRWHAVPPRSYRFFKACWKLLRPHGLMRLLLAEQQGAGRSRLLAGSIFLMFGQTVFYAFNGRSRADLALRPNDIIQWQAIRDACIAGFRHYDFGVVLEHNQTLAEFKSKWGSEARPLYRYYYPAPRNLEDGTLGTVSSARRLVSAIWRRLPLAATTVLGDVIYSFL